MGKLVEGVWDCPACGLKEIRASIKECPSCGKPQGTDTVFKLPNKITYVPKEKAAKINKNPNWQCSFCESLNDDDLHNCKGCGASKEDSEYNYFEMRRKEEERKREKEEAYQEEMNSYNNPYANNDKDKNNDSYESLGQLIVRLFSKFKTEIIGGTCALLGLSLFIGLFVFLFLPRNEELTINEFSWDREIQIQVEKTVDESDWSIPSGGRLQYQKEEIHHYDKVIDHYETIVEEKSRQVLDHYETVTEQKSRQVVDYYEEYVTGYRDLGNGYFEEITSSRPIYKTEYYTETHQEPIYRTEYYTETRQEPVYKDVPVYKTKYYYEIERWFYSHSIKTNGKDKNPYWGEYTLKEKERVSKEIENYYISGLNKKEEQKTYEVPFKAWEILEYQEVIKLKISLTGIEILDDNGEPRVFE